MGGRPDPGSRDETFNPMGLRATRRPLDPRVPWNGSDERDILVLSMEE